ncbi:MAG: YihY/virulence factor BrkB family protein [Rhodothermia bacterium]
MAARYLQRDESARKVSAWADLKFYVVGVVSRFWNENVLLWCGAIAFKVIVTILPLTLLALGIFGLFLREASVLGGLSRVVEGALPGGQADQIIEVLHAFAGASQTITLVGAVALLVTGISLFTTLRVVLENVFHKTHVRRSTLAGYATDLQMAIVCGGLFMGTLALTNLRGFAKDFGRLPDWMQQGWSNIDGWLGLVLPLVLTSTLFFLLYYLVPKPKPSARSALVGAAFAGVCWEVAKHAFAIFASHSAMFARLRNVEEQVELNTLGGLFILAVLLVFWVYYSSVILVVGGMITALRDERRGIAAHPETS